MQVLDSVEDAGLRAAAATCKDLRDLRVFPMDAREDGNGCVSDEGLVAISEGCPNLQSILYFCQRMTNAAVVTMSKNCQNLTSFRLCIMGRHKPDHITHKPMDEGFGAIVMNCKKLTRLAVSGLLTNKAFEYIGNFRVICIVSSILFICSRIFKLLCPFQTFFKISNYFEPSPFWIEPSPFWTSKVFETGK